MAKRPLVASLALIAGAAVGFGVPQQVQAAPPGAKDVTATLFQWKFDSVARECTNTLGPLGYGYVEVSPPQEHIQGSQWWTPTSPSVTRSPVGSATAPRSRTWWTPATRPV